MYKASNFLTQTKIIADLLILSLIIFFVQNWKLASVQQFFTGTNIMLLFISLTCWIFSASALKLYKDFRMKPHSMEWVAFLKALTLYTLLFSFMLFQLFPFLQVTRKELLVHCSLIFLLLPIQKLIIRILVKKIRNGENVLRKVLIVGAGQTGLNFYQDYVQNRNYGYKLTGFLDEERKQSLNGHYLGKTSEIESVINQHELDDIIVTLPMTSQSQIGNIISIGEKHGKRIRIIPDYQSFGVVNMHVDKLGALSMITHRASPLDFSDNKIYKRIFDIVFSFCVIVLIFPWLFPIIGLIIKLTSKGPVFFKQERWGINNRTITCYKFRSMVSTCKDVDENGKYMQASKNDTRITPIGSFLRKSNLDELPQFINVLLGSMSIVGPRPHPIPLNLESKDTVERYMMRHWIKPGITGWAQVNGYRGETKNPNLMKLRVQYDLWYMENWTFWLDQQIIMQTLVNIVKGEKNAY
jgi:putative colanic acid biosysnthesis UDP-glucose lipid carrier transferase